MQYFEEAKEIWQKFVPTSGQADTVQSELLRAVERLRDEAQRNGNMNWDEGYEIFLTYLEEKLSDPKVFEIDKVARIKHMLDRFRNYDDPYLEEDYYDELGDRVVEYFKFHGSIPHAENLRLYR